MAYATGALFLCVQSPYGSLRWVSPTIVMVSAASHNHGARIAGDTLG